MYIGTPFIKGASTWPRLTRAGLFSIVDDVKRGVPFRYLKLCPTRSQGPTYSKGPKQRGGLHIPAYKVSDA